MVVVSLVLLCDDLGVRVCCAEVVVLARWFLLLVWVLGLWFGVVWIAWFWLRLCSGLLWLRDLVGFLVVWGGYSGFPG